MDIFRMEYVEICCIIIIIINYSTIYSTIVKHKTSITIDLDAALFIKHSDINLSQLVNELIYSLMEREEVTHTTELAALEERTEQLKKDWMLNKAILEQERAKAIREDEEERAAAVKTLLSMRPTDD